MTSVTAAGGDVNQIFDEYSTQLDGTDDSDKPDASPAAGQEVARRADGESDVPADRRGSARADRVRELQPGEQLPTEIELRERYWRPVTPSATRSSGS